jgi:hypothetical protein
MKLQRIVGAQTDIETRLEEFRQRITFIGKEKGIIAEGTHRNANLF